ncbi:MAG: precorrin-6A reductase [Clostridia bacterium]|nr:precorrin-6A reductase [Clostridia bacterium]
MILLLGGTGDSRELARYLTAAGVEVLLTAVTEYGAQLAGETGVSRVLSGALTLDKLRELVKEQEIRTIVDATHPYAVEISRNAMALAEEMAIGYCRYERKGIDLEENPLFYRVSSLEEAAGKAAELGNNIFLTIGSKGLEQFLKAACIRGKRVVARVLPDRGIIEKCLDLGLTAREIIAMQGPFTYELNQAMYRQTAAAVVVTKESGHAGGTDSKLTAAVDMGIPVVIITRPELSYPNKSATFQEVLDYLVRSERTRF